MIYKNGKKVIGISKGDAPITKIYKGDKVIFEKLKFEEDVTVDNLADICLVNNNNFTEKIFVNADNLEKYKNDYTPIGIVVIPSSHDVYGTGECAIISISGMGYYFVDDLGAGNYIEWCSSNKDAGMIKYNVFNTVINATDNILGNTKIKAMMPSTNKNNNFKIISADGIAKYNNSPYAPSPYLANGSRNPNYYSKEKSEFNALSDFNGIENTKHIINVLGDEAKAAYICSQFKTKGTKPGDWYLPACGELGYLVARFDEINFSLKTIETIYNYFNISLSEKNGYYTSTESSFTETIIVFLDLGTMHIDEKNMFCFVRAFLRLGSK